MMGKQLRSGYTTGTCASAAARAAAVFLLTGNTPPKVRVCLGNGSLAEFAPEYRGFFHEWMEEGGSWCRVKKDAGDDPDVTDKVWVYAGVFPISRERFEELCVRGKGYVSKDYPGIYLNGGPGIGVALKKGLSCPVGHYAINPVPRQVIMKAVASARKETGYKGKLEIRVAVPSGISLADKTFNPKLGIQGGISILGTTGVVEPMSEQALVETIRLDIRIRAAAGEKVLLLTPGNYGEAFLEENMGVALGRAVKCSNFIGDAVEMAVEEGFERLLLAGHVGKLIKVTGGVRNTHSRYGDRRMELMEKLAEQVCRDRKDSQKYRLFQEIRGANTTEEAVGRLKAEGLAQEVLTCGAKRVQEQVLLWGRGRLKAQVIMFSSAHQVIGKTGQTERFLQLWRGEL